MDAVMTIRHLVLAKGESQRAVAERLGVSRNTVKRYVKGAPAGARLKRPRRKPKLETILADSSSWTAGKQRLTATQLWRMVRAEGHDAGASLVKNFMHEWKRRRAEVFVPLTYRPGELGEVDFFEVWVDVAGERQEALMFLLRGMASGRDFAWLFPRQDQTCFLEGHVCAFAHLGGVYERLVYDNLKPAVARVLAGSERELTRAFHWVGKPLHLRAVLCATGYWPRQRRCRGTR